MKRLLTSAGAVLLGLAVVGVTEASGPGGRSGGQSGGHNSSASHFNGNGSHFNGSGSSKNSFSNYHQTFGTKFSHGYFYKGNHHRHWTSWYWSPSYGCYFYWCPYASCYYYWSAPQQCYYPVSYIAVAPPSLAPVATAAAAANAAATTSQVVNVNNGTPPLPGAVPPVPVPQP
jgi:hypothetical protein